MALTVIGAFGTVSFRGPVSEWVGGQRLNVEPRTFLSRAVDIVNTAHLGYSKFIKKFSFPQ